MSDLTNEVAPAHDYLDDLQAFFYLLCWILLRYLKDGTLRPLNDTAWKVIRGWDSENVDEALNSKSALFNPFRRTKQTAISCVQKEWGQECATLFRKFLEWVAQIETDKEKARISSGPQDPEKESIYKQLLSQIIAHYTHVLSLFEEAVLALGGSCAKPPTLKGSEVGPSIGKRSRSPVQGQEEGPNAVRLRMSST